MRLIICQSCGKSWDKDVWVGCPHCARERYKRNKQYKTPSTYGYDLCKSGKVYG